MNNQNVSNYAQRAASNALDRDKASAGRKLKVLSSNLPYIATHNFMDLPSASVWRTLHELRQPREQILPIIKPPLACAQSCPHALLLATPASSSSSSSQPASTSQPSPSAGLSQNINGSENHGRKSREEFISITLNSATVGGAIPSTSSDQQPPLSTPAIDEDEDMVDQSDEEEDRTEGVIPGETTCLNRLKDLYSQQPSKAAQKALLSVLEELSRETSDDEGQQKPKRRKRAPESQAPWDQAEDDDYVCTDSPRQREKQCVALSGYIRIILCQLLKLKDKKSPLPHGPPPEVAAPTAAAFYVKWDESEKSEFNAIAARIVALRVVADYPSLCTLDKTHDMVTDHLKYLRTRYRRQTDPRYIAKEKFRLH
ncbi:hypothetical protein FS749_002120 [Ceratobasidium sp. UAMH 11750]|nr:hypothetical protein FS749_002120 [Ceratobasidium sp. UAMH 11750]